MLGSATQAIITKVQLSPDAMKLEADKDRYNTIIKTNGTYGMQNAGAKHINGYLEFQPERIGTATLYTYLGYANARVPSFGVSDMPANAFSWDAGTIFASSLKGQGFYVELMTGTCEGYDGLTGQRKNILAVIPESDSDSKILFQPSFPTFLEMNNSHPLVLRNIRARLLQTDGSSVEVTGLNSMTLLYKPGSSK